MDRTEKMLSPEKLDKAIRTLQRIEQMDDGPLYRKVRQAIAVKRARRRRLALIRTSAAVIVPAAVLVGGWMLLHNPQPGVLRQAEEVSLELPGGRQVALGDAPEGQTLADYGDAAVVNRGGALRVDKKAGAGSGQASVAVHTLRVPRGRQHRLVLEDGTRVWVNSESRLRFPATFGTGRRKVYIEGEACFEVAHDAARPFVVESARQTVSVLGTLFNVTAYPDDPATYTTLASGSVRIAGRAGGDMVVVLQPGQQAVYDMASEAFEVRTVDAAARLDWTRGIIDMEKLTLEQITATLSRYYDVEFDFRSPQARRIVYRGHTTRSGSIDEVLENLGAVSPVEFRREGRVIEVRMK